MGLAAKTAKLVATWSLSAAALVGTHAAAAPLAVSAPGLPSAFLDVSLEHRCDALAAFVRAFAVAHLASLEYREAGCGEGNGLGGARYTFDFRLRKGEGKAQANGFRLDVAFGEGKVGLVRLCDTDARPTVCTATDLVGLAALHPSASSLLPTVAAWVAAPQTKHLIYGQTYDAFVAKIVADQDGFPVAKPDHPGKLTLQLVPAKGPSPARGTVRFAGAVDADVLRCFGCTDLKCMNDGVAYRFDDRFFSVTRQTAAGEDAGASWIITGPRPFGEGEATWKYACGVSRYSLQSINL